jgi:Fe-S cluster biogenesis protein NfuA
VPDQYKVNLHPGCIPTWKKDEITISATTFRGNLTAYNCTTTFNNVLEDNVQYYFRIDCGNPLKYTFKENPVTIQIKGKCNMCPSETNMSLSPIGLTVVQMMLNAGNAWVSIVTALNWFGTQGSLMHLV